MWYRISSTRGFLTLVRRFDIEAAHGSVSTQNLHRRKGQLHFIPGEGTPSMLGDMDVPPFWPPFLTFWGLNSIFWGIFSHPPTPKRSFGVLKLPILTEFDLLGPKFHFTLDLFGSKFQRPAAHPHQFSDRVPPPGLYIKNSHIVDWLSYLYNGKNSSTAKQHLCNETVLS